MSDKKTFSIEVGGRTLSLEFSDLAHQANSAVMARYGDTVVLVTTVIGKKDKSTDYFPLMVDYEEKFYAAGKIIGSRFIRREGRPSEEAILSGRLIDRAIRPLFDSRIRRDVQVVVTVISYDEDNDPDALALVAASTALSVSDIPWNGPVAGLKVAQIGDELVVNPLLTTMKATPPVFEAFVAGTEDRINMVELGGYEASATKVLEAFALAQKEIKKLTDFQDEIVKSVGKEKMKMELKDVDPELLAAVKKYLGNKLEGAVYTKKKTDMHDKISELGANLKLHLKDAGFEEDAINGADGIMEEEVNDLIHKKILGEELRPDGRKLDEVRALSSQVSILPRTHGSASFMRGDTQSLAVTTLGEPGASQLIETMETTGKRRFLLHYNFPAYSVGEIGPFRGPGRREIGHGALAEKAVRPLIPPAEEFPYTIRVVSEILSSNGSSSMATVCATCLSLMDAGVPIKKPAAGIAMGLIVEQGTRNKEQGTKYKVLTDIQGPEDHHGDMDFKVAGTDSGINAMQMDVKIDGLTLEMIEATVKQAEKARLHILDNMKSALASPRPEISKYAPIIISLTIDPTRIGEVIGSGGKIINKIIEETGSTSIDIEDDGKVFVTAPSKEAAQKAVAQIELILREFKVGDVIEGNVIKILEFGAIVDLGGGQDGMIHVSELKSGYVNRVEDVLKLGDFVRAKVIRNEDGKIGLSLKQM